MHVAKRFGIVGASQLPLHYLLAIKSPWSPIALLTRRSHEQLNVYHQILGRIIQTLLSLHAIFYLNFFWQFGWLAKRVKDNDVILGLSAITTITLIGTTALSPLRRWSYRIFYFVHILGATFLLPILYYHVVHIQTFILEAAAVYILHILLRFISSKRYPGTLSIVPGTNLVQVSIPTPTKNWKPGQHIYLTTSIPLTGGTVGTLKNPFTIASLPKADGNLTLIARTLKGNTKTLASRARTTSLSGSSIKLQIEGPYGLRLPNFAQFDRVLLVAGGVGATFIIPIYRSILNSRLSAPNNTSLADIRLVWSVRKISDTTWALPIPETSGANGNAREMGAEQDLYITGSASEETGYKEVDQGESIEMMGEREGLVGDGDEGAGLEEQGVIIKHRRPDLRDIVDEVFSHGQSGRVAVLVCGPTGMGAQVRREVGRWVKKGKNVYFHSEEFGL
jgi:predicted ferric reductase